MNTNTNPWRETIATSFADPEDIRRFRAAKAAGLSDIEAFKRGDNGRGFWGDDTTTETPACALPPEDWKPLQSDARGARVEIEYLSRWVVAELRDTMPHRRNIKNGAGIDLNPAAVAVLGLSIPCRAPVRWRWADRRNNENIRQNDSNGGFLQILKRFFTRASKGKTNRCLA